MQPQGTRKPKGPQTIQQLREYPGFAHLSDEAARKVLAFIRDFAQLFFDIHNNQIAHE